MKYFDYSIRQLIKVHKKIYTPLEQLIKTTFGGIMNNNIEHLHNIGEQH